MKKKINYSKKILLSMIAIMLSCGMIANNVISANDDETIIDDVEETTEPIEKEPIDSTEEYKDSAEVETVVSDTIQYNRNELARTVVPDDWAFTEASKPLHDAILNKYDADFGGTGNVDSDGDGYISILEANNWTGTSISLIQQGITGTIDGIENFKKITVLDLNRNLLEGSIPSGISEISNLKTLSLYFNNLTGNIPPELGNLSKLEFLLLYHNQLSGSIPQELSKITTLKRAVFYSNDLDASDLSALTIASPSLTLLGVTRITNADLSNITELYISGSRDNSDSIIRIDGSAGAFSWESGYYAIAANKNVRYRVIGTYYDSPENTGFERYEFLVINLDEKALVDNEGNIIVGASTENIVDGKVILPNGGTIITTNGSYIFNGTTTIDGNTITTNDNVVVQKNTLERDEDGNLIVGYDETVTDINLNNDNELIIELNNTGSSIEIPNGNTITNNEGDTVYVIDEVIIDNSGDVSSGSYITVPNGSAVTDNGDGTIIIPENTIVTIDGEDTAYPGEIIFDTSTGKTEFIPISGLITADEVNGTNLGNGVNETDVSKADEILNSLPEGKLKDQLQEIVDTAKDMIEASKKVNDLYNEDGTLKDTVTEEVLKEVEEIVSNLPDGTFKDNLKDKVEVAQDTLNQRNEEEAKEAVDNLFNKDKTDLKDGVGQEEIDNAQKAINKLPDNSDLRNELQKEIDKAQDILDAKDAVNDLFNPDGSIKDGIIQEDINEALELVNKLPNGSLKDELLNLIKEVQKEIDERNYIVLEGFNAFTGKGDVSAKIDAPIENFSKVYVNEKELDKSNYVVTSGSTVVTLNEAYLKTLANGTYDVEVEFVSGARVSVPLTINVKVSTSVAPPAQKPNKDVTSTVTTSAVNTGDETDLGILYGLLTMSLLGIVVVIGRKKRA